MQFKGTRWQSVSDQARQTFVANSYRVLLTRGRQGMVVLFRRAAPRMKRGHLRFMIGSLRFCWNAGSIHFQSRRFGQPREVDLSAPT